jgi:hypothetical protein
MDEPPASTIDYASTRKCAIGLTRPMWALTFKVRLTEWRGSMAAKKRKNTLALSSIGIEGFKSIRDRHDVELRQLTILAGANSTGKSSLMQPLLLLKQTVDSSIDPGPLKLDGPNVRFARFEEMLWLGTGTKPKSQFAIRLALTDDEWIEESFRRNSQDSMEIAECLVGIYTKSVTLREGMSRDEISQVMMQLLGNSSLKDIPFVIKRDKCWLNLAVSLPGFPSESLSIFGGQLKSELLFSRLRINQVLTRLLHLPGLRGAPSRIYPANAVGPTFPGTFPDYAASMVMHWTEHDKSRLLKLGKAMKTLGLTWKVAARKIDDTKIELLVGRTLAPKRGGAHDMVSIADVGIGVSQSLPVVVALIAAEPGQLVYAEQPEIHLHPDAQVAMATLLADSAKRGAQVIVETHSNLLVLGIQTLVAEGKLDPALVKLHWFERDESGATTITPADLDENGAFGEWPEDFDKISLQAQRAYLDAARA